MAVPKVVPLPHRLVLLLDLRGDSATPAEFVLLTASWALIVLWTINRTSSCQSSLGLHIISRPLLRLRDHSSAPSSSQEPQTKSPLVYSWLLPDRRFAQNNFISTIDINWPLGRSTVMDHGEAHNRGSPRWQPNQEGGGGGAPKDDTYKANGNMEEVGTRLI